MTSRLSALPLVIVALFVVVLPVRAEEAAKPKTEPAASIKAQLDAKGLKYEVDKDGDFKMIYEMADSKRTQTVFVRSPTFSFGGLEAREIWSPAYRSEDGKLPVDVANSLLEQNAELKLGAWENQGGIAVMVMKIPADASADQLIAAIEGAAAIADGTEKAFSGDKDAF